MGLDPLYTLAGIQITSLSQQASSRRIELRLSFLLVTLSGGCGSTWRSDSVKGKGGKPIIKIQKLNWRLLLRRQNAVQRTPPRAHSAGADYADYTVLNWKAEMWTNQSSSEQPIKAFSESISNVNISFCTECIIFDRLWEREKGVEERERERRRGTRRGGGQTIWSQTLSSKRLDVLTSCPKDQLHQWFLGCTGSTSFPPWFTVTPRCCNDQISFGTVPCVP